MNKGLLVGSVLLLGVSLACITVAVVQVIRARQAQRKRFGDEPAGKGKASATTTNATLMRSGYDDYEGIWGNSYYDDQFGEIEDRDFVQKVFRPSTSLISNTALAPDDLPKHTEARVYEDGTVEIPYTGQDYDRAKFRLVARSWDHVHCSVCRYSVDEGQTYWENGIGDELCDACYEHYVLGVN